MEPIMRRNRIATAVLAACALGATACEHTPFEVAERPSFSLVGSGVRFFTEDFNGGPPAADRLEVSTAYPLEWEDYALPDFTSGAAVFTGWDDYTRTYLRTVATYLDTDVVAEVTVTVPAGGPLGISFIGFGSGHTGDCEFYCEPAGFPAIYLRVLPNGFGDGSAATDHTSGNIIQEHIGLSSVGGTGTHRVRMSWNAATQQVTFAVDEDYTGGQPFAADVVIGPIAAAADAFDATNARIFFGGANGATFDDLSISRPPVLSAFRAPVSNDGLNRARAGQAVPLKFSLGGDYGLDIFASGYPSSGVLACDLGGGVSDVIGTSTAGSSALWYDAESDTYTYVWKTDRSWADSCRRLTVRLADGQERTADFSFTK
jgi:hypothetical protein